SVGHAIMLTGHSQMQPGFSSSMPKPTDWPSIAAIAGAVTRRRNNLPPAAVLPDRLVHYSGRVIPGQVAGMMGSNRDPWFIAASPFDSLGYGAYPEYSFDHQERGKESKTRSFQAPNLTLHQDIAGRLYGRLDL